MRRTLVAGNWKMNGSREHLETFAVGLKANIADGVACELGICPTYVYLSDALRLFADTPVEIGAQNVSLETASGAFTGEVPASMVADIGCRFAIVGHSERRHVYGDTDAQVAQRFAAVREAGLTPVLCVGETLEEREAGTTQDVVKRQLEGVFEVAKPDGDTIIAYEPVWAIGTGRAAAPDDAQAVHAYIRDFLKQKDATLADSVTLLYGGSVKPANAGTLFSQPDIDGFLVGGASLKADDFYQICQAAA